MNSSTTNDPLLRAHGLRHSFVVGENRVDALREVTLESKSGEVTSVVGPSGCGKSTLLYLLGLLDRPDRGEIFLEGESLAHADDKIRTSIRNNKIGFVFQFHFLIKELTVRENVALPLRKGGHSENDALLKAEHILEKLGLEDKVGRFANKLSGGEQQRVAIARALVNSPSLLLADEPTGNLDSTNSRKVFDLFRKFAQEENIAVILVTHNTEIAQRCDRILRMIDGKMINE